MDYRHLIAFGAALGGILWSAGGSADEPQPLSTEQVDFFEKRIRPILVDKCYECHSADANELEGGLMLDNRAAVQKGGESGPVVIPGKPDASPLVTALKYLEDEIQMPPGGKLPDAVIADFERWVRLGAADPRDGPPPPLPDSIEARARRHWAFLEPTRVPLPEVSKLDWPRDSIDHYVLERLERARIEPATQAAPRALIRRLFYDLTGLPPSFEQVQAFAADPSPEAYERLVDERLESQHFGERWARHWLDVARFGDTKGYVFTADRNYPHAYKYRDWVIASFNRDLPYDQFLRYQIAGDRFLEKPQREQLAALGFLTLGRRFLNNGHDLIDDRIDVVFRGTMGLTVGCARCHDHKYDPVSTEDYYAIYGVFFSSREQQDDDLPLRLVDKDRSTDVRVFLRGSPGNRGDVVRRRFPRFFTAVSREPFAQGSGRQELAEAITSPRNPLTARVLVNRVWGHLFGAGLVPTPSDFGLRSEPPLHLDVLDELALDFMQQGWSLKRLIRRIVLSSTYRQTALASDGAEERDPENLLLSRGRLRRLDFEAMRDSLLAAAGNLDLAVGGPSVKLDGKQPSHRRALYAHIDRQNLPGLFRTFDFASPDTHSPQRPRTTVPQQALYLMNNAFVQQAAIDLAGRVASAATDEARVRQLHRLALARDPTDDELALGCRFLASDARAKSPPGKNLLTGLQRYAQALLLTNEFMFLD